MLPSDCGSINIIFLWTFAGVIYSRRQMTVGGQNIDFPYFQLLNIWPKLRWNKLPSMAVWHWKVFLCSYAKCFCVVVALGLGRDLRSFEIRFEFKSAIPIRFESDGPIRKFRIGRVCPLLVVVIRLKPLTALNGTVLQTLYSSHMSDHTPVLFNVFEDWNEKSVVPHISFVSFVINDWLLNARYDLYSVGLLRNMLGP